jgi:hypothetical protein
VREPLDPQFYRRVFEDNPDGAAILDELTARFMRPPVLQGGIDGVLETYRRLGARDVPEFIVNRINRAHNPDWGEEDEQPVQ